MFATAAKGSRSVRTWLNLCTAAMLTEDWQEAERACRYVLDNWPNNVLAKEYIKRIERREPSHGKVEIYTGEFPSCEV
jgi:hypothetical protein